jgi:predicted permease
MMHILDNAWKDLRFALRQLANRPGFTVTAITVLALGLGANAAIFSVVNAVLLQALPFPHAEKLMGIFEREVGDDEPYNLVAPGNYLDWRRDAHSFQQIAATREISFNFSSKGQALTPERIPGSACSANLFQTLEVSPTIGRGFQEHDDQPNSPYVAVISYEIWKQRFGGSPDVLHQQIRLDENNYSIVGVMPEGFHYPRRDVQVWVTLNRSLTPKALQSHSSHFLYVLGRLRDGYTSHQAQAEIDAFVKHYRQDHPTETMGKGATVIRLDSYLIHDIRTSLLVLLGAVGCLLLIACVNIANLLLTRALGCQREVAIRSAIGASHARIIGQLLIESTTISLAGAVAGLTIAAWARRSWPLTLPAPINCPKPVEFKLTTRFCCSLSDWPSLQDYSPGCSLPIVFRELTWSTT